MPVAARAALPAAGEPRGPWRSGGHSGGAEAVAGDCREEEARMEEGEEEEAA